MAWEHVLLHGGEVPACNPESQSMFYGEAVWVFWELSTLFGIQPKKSTESSAFSWLGSGCLGELASPGRWKERGWLIGSGCLIAELG